ncbi:hypothetical protein GCM10010123_31480 [Pilimelia anulata]|uniref:Alpha/beta hydrolase fold-3 domain-containing protein n=1 Tax=Pilimelia anulata TaxID=53371 RepID=A0A8J3B7N2_9ACTN|nr:alpha/beta hydrolase fold domain-containing protein [Pilimelia anulata]GGJ99253.1 hypothetical protein GCM10010123_31480 [Pilimelia anulata]
MPGRDAEYLAALRDQRAAAGALAGDPPAGDDGALVRYWREVDRAVTARLPRPDVRVAALTVPGAAGDLAARRYHAAGGDPRTLLLYLHGGGWCFGDLDTADPVARALAVDCRLDVLSVTYRLAPEHPFPAGPDDATAVLRWALSGPPELAGVTRLVAAGDSAGGNLAAVAAGRLRAAGGPLPAALLLLYPGVDLRDVPPAPADPDGLPADDGSGPLANRRRYLAGADPADPAASPLLADPRGLPPTVVVTAEYDRYAAQGDAYAAALAAAGVPVAHVRAAGLDHGFANLAPLSRVAAAAVVDAAEALRSLIDLPH